MTEPSHPKDAATIILLRRQSGGGFEAFMTRRPDQMKFLGGMYVFPGGTVRPEDYTEGVLKRCRGLTVQEAQKIIGPTLGREICLGHWVAAVRELFEEVGILLCVTETGEPLKMSDEDRRDRTAARRLALIQREIDFQSFLESEGLLCDLTKLVYFSHWQTPQEFSMRFNTRFYLAELPPDQEPLPYSQEVTHSVWLTPERSLQLCEQGKLPLIFPTFACLRRLADFDTLESLAAEYGRG
jgi:8-oxo-dGTP pyrophosphatase MutT (NUDIX family)